MAVSSSQQMNQSTSKDAESSLTERGGHTGMKQRRCSSVTLRHFFTDESPSRSSTVTGLSRLTSWQLQQRSCGPALNSLHRVLPELCKNRFESYAFGTWTGPITEQQLGSNSCVRRLGGHLRYTFLGQIRVSRVEQSAKHLSAEQQKDRCSQLRPRQRKKDRMATCLSPERPPSGEEFCMLCMIKVVWSGPATHSSKL